MNFQLLPPRTKAASTAAATASPARKSDSPTLREDLPPASLAAFDALLPLHNALVAMRSTQVVELAALSQQVDDARHSLEMALAEDRLETHVMYGLINLYGDRSSATSGQIYY